MTSSFVYESAEQAAASFLLDALATASGQSATAVSLLNLLRSGDPVVMAGQISGGTSNVPGQRFAEIGIGIGLSVVPVDDHDAWRAAIRPGTRRRAGAPARRHHARDALPPPPVRSSTGRTSSCTRRRRSSSATAR